MLKKKRKKRAPGSQLTNEDISIIRYYLYQVLQSTDKITSEALFNMVRDDLSRPFELSEFRSSLSPNFKNNRIPGYKTTKGRSGGISLENKEIAAKDLPDLPPKKAETPSEEEEFEYVEVEEKPKEEKDYSKQFPNLLGTKSKEYYFAVDHAKTWLWIKDSRYQIPTTRDLVLRFLRDVMEAKVDDNGSIVIWIPETQQDDSVNFIAKRFEGDEDLLHKFLIHMVGTPLPDISEPLLTTVDKNDMPIIFIDEVFKDPSPQTLQKWNQNDSE